MAEAAHDVLRRPAAFLCIRENRAQVTHDPLNHVGRAPLAAKRMHPGTNIDLDGRVVGVGILLTLERL